MPRRKSPWKKLSTLVARSKRRKRRKKTKRRRRGGRESEDSEEEDIPWYEDEEFWLGDSSSGGYDWDQHTAATRASIVLATKAPRLYRRPKVALHYCWLPLVIYLGMQHPINGKTITLRDVLGFKTCCFVRRHAITRSYDISIDIVRRFFSRGERNGGREEVQSSFCQSTFVNKKQLRTAKYLRTRKLKQLLWVILKSALT